MGKIYEKLDDKLINFIEAQKMFFVATAPLDAEGHVNLSPKGYDAFKVIDEMTVAYLDLGGSGIETQAHIQENGRMTIMFCAFEGAPNILRLYGEGEAIQFDDPRFANLIKLFPNFEKARAIITLKISRIADSCGWGVPFYEFKGERDQLKRTWDHAYEQHGDAVGEHFYESNAKSIDGLQGMKEPS